MSFSCVQWWSSFSQCPKSQCVVSNTQTVPHGVGGGGTKVESGEKGNVLSRSACKCGRALESRPRGEHAGLPYGEQVDWGGAAGVPGSIHP